VDRGLVAGVGRIAARACLASPLCRHTPTNLILPEEQRPPDRRSGVRERRHPEWT
jgi:hypothetical protein